MTKEEKVEQLVDWLMEHMEVPELENWAKITMTEYLASDTHADCFERNYLVMQECVGED